MDPLRELRRLLERLLHVASQLLEERLRRHGIVVHQPFRELEVDRERNEVLLDAVVQLALDPASVAVGCQDERPKPRVLSSLHGVSLDRFGRYPVWASET